MNESESLVLWPVTDLFLWIDAGHFDDSQADGDDRLTDVLHRWSSEKMVLVESSDAQTVQFHGTVVLRRDHGDGHEQKANSCHEHSTIGLVF